MTQLAKKARVGGLRDVVLASAKTGHGIPELLGAIAKHQAGRPIYVVGYANVGKSCLLNRMNVTDEYEPTLISDRLDEVSDRLTKGDEGTIKEDGLNKGSRSRSRSRGDEGTSREYERQSIAPIGPSAHYALSNPSGTTVSGVPGTTLHLVSVEIGADPSLTVIDTPGLLPDFYPPSFLHPKVADVFSGPPAQIKPVTYSLDAGGALGVSHLAVLHHLSGDPVEVTCFLPPRCQIRRGTSEKMMIAMEGDLKSLGDSSGLGFMVRIIPG